MSRRRQPAQLRAARPAGCDRARRHRHVTGFFVNTCKPVAACASAAHRVLHDAILERVERDHREPPALPASRDAASCTKRSSPSSSPFTQIRSAWNVRVAGSIRCQPRVGTARRTSDASSPVVVIGRRGHERSRDAPACSALRRTGRSRRRAPAPTRAIHQIGRRRAAPTRSIRMSSGSSRRKLNPRPSASNCSDDTPRSARTPSTVSRPRASSTVAERPVIRVHRRRADRRTPQARFRASLSASRVAVEPDHPISASLQQRPRVAAEAERAVDVSPAAPGLQERQHFVEQYGLMQRRDVVPRPSFVLRRRR